MNLRDRMALACIDELEPHERVPSGSLQHIIEICARTAGYTNTPPKPALAEPPRLLRILASYLIPGDQVWMRSCRFVGIDRVEILLNDWTEKAHRQLFYNNGAVQRVAPERPFLVASDRDQARRWNLRNRQPTDLETLGS
jgi:hypothetical protein